MVAFSLVDRAFFLLETDDRPMNIGSLTVIAPAPRVRKGFADRLVRRMVQRPVGPPFNHRLKTGTLIPELVVDDHIDPRKQVHRVRLPHEATLAQLFDHVCKLHVRRLLHEEPLWQAYVFDGLADGRVAVYFKTHHGIIDGIGFIDAYVASVSRSPRAGTVRAVWEGVSGERRHRRRESDVADLLQAAYGEWRGKLRAAGDFGRLLLQEALRSSGLGRGLALPFLQTPDSFKTAPSRARALGHTALPLARIRAIGRDRTATVNDVLLTVLDMAMRRYLEDHGAAPDAALVADMPVALSKEAGTGNRITILQVPLGRGGLTPVERLEAVRQETAQVKEELRNLAGDALVLYSILVHGAASAIEALGLRGLPMLANAVISNPYGVAERGYCMGAPIELCLPVSVVAHHQSINITATTYMDDLHVTCIGVREALPDIQRLADLALEALGDLEAALAAPPADRRQRRAKAQRARAKPD